MKITKYVHSCLLVETPERVGLFDPGEFSWQSGTFDIATLSRLDDIIITHEHADHFHLPFVQALVARFPEVHITTTGPVSEQLRQAAINATTESSNYVKVFSAPHESLEPLSTTPANIGVHYADQLTHPGDSHHFSDSKSVLALPITAPWGTIMRAAQLGLELRPRIVIPIHDWHYRDEARTSFYERLESFFGQYDIAFFKPQDGAVFETKNDAIQ